MKLLYTITILMTLAGCGEGLFNKEKNKNNKDENGSDESTELEGDKESSSVEDPKDSSDTPESTKSDNPVDEEKEDEFVLDPDNLLKNCDYDGSTIYDCSFNEKTIVEKQEKISYYKAVYKMTDCSSGMPPVVIENLDNNSFVLLHQKQENGEVSFSGIGPFVVKVLEKERFERAFFWRDCFVNIVSVSPID